MKNQRGLLSWMAGADIAEWFSTCRLSVLGNAGPYLGEPATQEAFGRMLSVQVPAVKNLQRLLAEVDASGSA